VTCPASAFISALVEEGTDSELGRSVWGHVSTCDSCSDLYRRLLAFSQVSAEDPRLFQRDQAWIDAKPRLDRAIQKVTATQRNPLTGSKPRHYWFSTGSPTLKWALSFCAASLVLGVTLILYGGFERTDFSTRESADARVREPGQLPPEAKTTDPGTMMSSSNSGGSAEPTKSDSPASTAPETLKAPMIFNLSSGTTIELVLTFVQAGRDSTLAVEGTLVPLSLPDSPAEFEEAHFSGTLTDQLMKGQISIRQITKGGVSYSVMPPPAAVALDQLDHAIQLQAGQRLKGHTVQDLTVEANPR